MISVMDHGFKFADAIYETMRTINGKPWLLNEHLVRLRKSAKELGLKVPLTNAQIKSQISRLLKKNNHKESRIRITLTRGSNNFDFNSCKKPTLLIEATKLSKPRAIKKGIATITYKIERIAPHLKSTNMLSSILARQEAHKHKAFEALLVDRHNNITEGAFSNIFVVQKGQLITPKDGILEGTTRNFILKKYPKVRIANIPLAKIHKYDEIFITSSTNFVVPVVKVDGRPIKNGKIGRITQNIIKLLPL
ncbi:aminotransferase class IV [Patescibacteria group bacterium]